MSEATLTIDPAFTVGDVDPRLFGSFVEHLGRCVYTGIYEPDHPAAGADGFRRDVLALVRELGVTTVRYPGGNFVSGHRWEDGVGPERRARLDPAWRSIEPNTFGLGEFMAWTRAAGVAPMMAVNLGTRGLREALDLLEYANHPSGTALSDLRRAHGAAEPYDIRLWCLGNEMDGPWQLGERTAEEYGRLAVRTARAMRMIDPDLELVACGSSGAAMPTFGAWEATVLSHAYEEVDHLSLHAYYEPLDGDVASFLASGALMESQIEDAAATCDHVRALTRSKKRVNLSFDEWNVWYMTRSRAAAQEPWRHAPRLLEDHYDVTDAVVVGSLLIALLRHADRVRMACQAQLVNVIAPIRTEPGGPAWRQTTFHPFAQASRHGRGRVLRVEPRSPVYECAAGEVPLLHATAVQGRDGTVTLFAVNRSRDEPLDLAAGVRALGDARVLEHTVLADADPAARNTAADPARVRPRPAHGAAVDAGTLRATLPPVSWNVIRLGR
ncbi:alpha-N-arabinofuranosidase [Microtetraspora sp. NBRC 13810]|uniref:arabinosylfuranosidase ArfA n=1 Tax=Microtetraspora sp. NBRC 13810 TaxID=3030990 RepID=UPI0024A1EE9D|nr:alpha-N-arabinofuranosidase [Microtetraspora sp. NBRC 13810]GLW13027.1 alpha-N-arabinofuranosidase [Microtetraspora sp. NBRC 13810]